MTGHLARLGPPELIAVAPGEPPVAVTTVKGRCWAASPCTYAAKKYVRCDRRARKGHLTCGAHKRWEWAAQWLAKFTQGASSELAREQGR